MFQNNRILFCKDFSIDDAIALLEDFKSAPKNKQNTFYHKICNRMKQHLSSNYINPIAKFLRVTRQDDDRELSGFIVMGVNCILIEFYYELINGFNYSNSKGHKIQNAYTYVLPLLDDSLRDKPYLTTTFYKGIRCGIIHQGQTKGNTAITFEFDTVISLVGEYFLCNPETIFKKLELLYQDLFEELENTNCHTISGQNLILKYYYILKSMDNNIKPLTLNLL